MAGSSKRLLVFGATGPTGRQVVSQALAREHHVTAFGRRVDGLPPHARLRLIQGDVIAQPDAVARGLDGQDAIVSVIGRGRGLRSNHLIERWTDVLVAAMEARGPKRVVFTSAYGVAETGVVPLVMRLIFATVLRDIYADKAIGEKRLRQSKLDWTIVCPSMLTDDAASGQYRSGEELTMKPFAKVSRADVADCLIRCVEDSTTIRRRLIVSS